MNSVVMRRAGNLLQVSDPDLRGLNPAVVAALDECLGYWHKTFYRGYEKILRKQAGAANPGLETVWSKLYRLAPGGLYCGAGMKSRITAALGGRGIPFEYQDVRQKRLPAADWDRLLELPDLELRHKQGDALVTIDAAEGGVIEAPTGYGKGFILRMLCAVYPSSRIMVVSPGLSLLDSTYRKLLTVTGDVGRIGAGHCESDARVLLCSADSLHRAPLDEVSLLIYDEVHTCGTAKRSKALSSRFTEAKFIGFTASPNKRADGADAVVESLFGPLLTSISYGEASEAGVVSPIQVWFERIPLTSTSPFLPAGDVQRKRVMYWRNEDRNRKVAQAIEHGCKLLKDDNPQILVMVETVEHAYELSKHLPGFELVYSSLNDARADELSDGGYKVPVDPLTTAQQMERLKRFETGELRRVISTHCWKQGIDPVQLKMFVRADGGTSAINNIQLPGRLSRLHGDKEYGLLVDFWDEADPWTLRRSKTRLADYKKIGFSLLNRGA
jgi:superfamily II DNA or RNA helicase